MKLIIILINDLS